MKKPFLLAPCGSYEAIKAAVAAGADECYFGGNAGNARMNAKGFSDDEFFKALELLRLHGVRSNITVNTLFYDREFQGAVEFVKSAHAHGADAFIVQDIGLAKVLKSEITDIELHASTQCACHSLDGAIKLSELGFSRIVLARELSYDDIKKITEYGKGKFETEVFVHGALCVCHSGMCLMSSVIGGRSGNRGLCAQPCRMQGELSNADGNTKKGLYPLSLRDLTLSRHISELLPLGISSLKIEGRMKSPEYVYRTTKILRELIDSGTDADEQKYRELSEIFSRGGFTDGYFTKKYLIDNRKMYGYRSDADKAKTADVQVQIPDIPKIPANLEVRIKQGQNPYAKFSANEKTGEFLLDTPASYAKSAPITEQSLIKNMSKLGSTPFVLDACTTDLDDGLFLAASEINALRRGASDALHSALMSDVKRSIFPKTSPEYTKFSEKRACKSPKLRFFTDNPNFIVDNTRYSEQLESICLPLELFRKEKGTPQKPTLPFGVRLPRVIFENEKENVISTLLAAKESGARYVYISNIGHIEIAKTASLETFGGIGLNVTNSESFLEYANMGLSCITLSPELKCAQMRDILRATHTLAAVVCEGRLPLMVLESCILRANGLCTNYGEKHKYCGYYTDRIGKKFEILPERRFTDGSAPCRNIILNADTLHLYGKSELSGCGAEIWEIYTD